MSNIKPNKNQIFLPLVLLVLVDVILVNAGMLGAFWLRFGRNIPDYNLEPFVAIVPWLSVATVVMFLSLGLYERQHLDFGSLLRKILVAVVGVFLVSVTVTFWLRGFAFPRSVLVLGFLLQAFFMTAWRYVYWYLDKKYNGSRNILLIGALGEVEELLGKILDLPRGWFRIKKILDVSLVDQLEDYLNDVDGVLLVPSTAKEVKAKVLVACQGSGREIYLIPDFYDILVGNARVVQLADWPVLEIRDISLTRWQRVVKRSADIGIALLGLVVTAPVLVICAVLVGVTTPGPVFYTQLRVGRDKRVFPVRKFRTMVNQAEQETGPVLATDDDPRITPVGRILRAARLDELPQLFNVLKGEMSIVGPRPERPVFVEQYNRIYPDYHYRHLVKPGITGLAQVAGKYTTSWEDKLRFDLYYIRNYSFWLDLKIIIQTIPVLLSKESAAGRKDISPDQQATIDYIVDRCYEMPTGTGNKTAH